MTAHVHADLMMQYAKLAQTTNRPYDSLQFQRKDETWQTLAKHPHWHSGTNYRFIDGNQATD